jgi:arylsulfatase A-like enzyme
MEEAMSDHRLNVLFLVSDDLRCELGCYGRPHVVSPNLDALAADAIRFDRAYCQQAICAPSRASVLTGTRPDTTGIYDLQTPVSQGCQHLRTLPRHFRDNGYETVSVGKVYHHHGDDLPGWSRPPFRAEGRWRGRGYVTDEAIEQVERYNAQAEAEGWKRRGLGPAWEVADVDDEAYHDGMNAAAAVAELERLAETPGPWFLAAGFIRPHLPFSAPRPYWDLYDHHAVPLADNPFPPEGASGFSLTNFGELRGYTNMPAQGAVDEEAARRLVHGYLACVSYMDAQIGKVLRALERTGQRERTVVVFWGDHGWKLGEHGSWCKHTNFEIDARAPLLLSTPATLGRSLATEALVEFVDVYPTLCEACGLDLPGHLEGSSLMPLIDRPDRPWKPAAFHQYPRRGESVMGYAVRTDRWHYVEWIGREDGRVLDRELYDHHADPAENVNLAAAPRAAETVERLSRVLSAGWRAARPPAG